MEPPSSWLAETVAIRTNRRRRPCRLAGGPVATAASAGGAVEPAPPRTFKFDMKRWSQADRIAGGATLVLFISLFLPWFSYRFGIALRASRTPGTGSVHGYLYIALIICLAIFAYLVARGFEQLPFKMPVGHEAAILIATVVNLVLVVHRVHRQAVRVRRRLELRRLRRPWWPPWLRRRRSAFR